MNTELAVASPQNISVHQDGSLQVSAFTPDEMLHANSALIQWCDGKIASLESEHKELSEAVEHAKLRKWKTSTLAKHANLSLKRIEYFRKMKGALEQGFYIVPNFPVTMFAIRTSREKPLRLATFSRWGSTLEQPAQALPAGEGEYKNPLPEVWQSACPTEKEPDRKEYWAEFYKDIEFPINMAKPQIMEAVTRAMALNIFDEFGILPDPKPKRDPVIIGRIIDPRSVSYSTQKKHISFIIAWHLDTRVL